MLKGFKDFLMRGNVVDLAVAVVIGVAFGAVVKSVVDGLITPLVGMIFGKPNLDDFANFHILKGYFHVGPILSQVLDFVLVAGAIYFVIIVPMNKLMALRKRGEEPETESPAEDVLLLQEIRDLLRAQNSR